MKITKYSVNNVKVFKYKDYIITAKRLKNTVYGNPRYEVNIIRTNDINSTIVLRKDLKYTNYGYNSNYIIAEIYDLEKEIIEYIKKNYKTSE